MTQFFSKYLKKSIQFIFLFPALLISQNVSVTFENGFVGTMGTSSAKANSILNFSTLEIQYATFTQADSDADGKFTLQGNDIAGNLQIIGSFGTNISYDAVISWRDSNQNEVFGVLLSPNDNPPLTVGSILYQAGLSSFDLFSGSESGTSSNIGLIIPNASFNEADGNNVSGNVATNSLLTALNNYLTSVL